MKLLPTLSIVVIILISWTTSKLNARIEPVQPPRLTVVIVIDQFAYHYLPKLHPYLTGGIKKMMAQSTYYKRAYFPHGIPETTPGHHTLSTATLPKDHGAVTNQWVNPVTYEKIIYAQHEVTDNTGKKTCESTPSRTMTDGLSDQFMLKNHGKKQKAFAFSIKDYPAISMAHQLGKAIWFDSSHGSLQTAPTYFTQLPAWAQAFHADNYLDAHNISWKLTYPANHAGYQFSHSNNYDYAGLPFTMAGNPTVALDRSSKKPYELFMKSPQASRMLLDAAQACITHELTPNSSLLLWISLSNLDLAGHIYGPHSRELIDLLYHIDRQLNDFFHELSKKISHEELLIVLTGDHGIAPIPEIMFAQGYTGARRIIASDLMKKLNQQLGKSWDRLAEHDLIKVYEPTSFTLDKKLLETFSPETQQAITKKLCDLLKSEPGIKNAWTYDELYHRTNFKHHELESYYKNQLYFGRSGDIIIQPAPYCQLTHYPTGTSHMTPYEYDTHVPLMLYRKNHIMHKVIKEKVFMPQLSVTLAHLLGIELPSATIFEPLPGLE